MLKVVLFASLREALGTDGLTVELPAGATVSDLIGTLADSRGDAWREALTAESVLVAVNQDLCKRDAVLGDGDEVAFLPPVTGG